MIMQQKRRKADLWYQSGWAVAGIVITVFLGLIVDASRTTASQLIKTNENLSTTNSQMNVLEANQSNLISEVKEIKAIAIRNKEITTKTHSMALKNCEIQKEYWPAHGGC